MAGGGAGPSEAQFKGWQKHFNTYTIRGRSNITFATYGALALLGLYMYLKPKKKQQS
ncbi:Up-regulated during skeletal muscle growth protein 5, partial [Stegodyphus mimosarum]